MYTIPSLPNTAATWGRIVLLRWQDETISEASAVTWTTPNLRRMGCAPGVEGTVPGLLGANLNTLGSRLGAADATVGLERCSSRNSKKRPDPEGEDSDRAGRCSRTPERTSTVGRPPEVKAAESPLQEGDEHHVAQVLLVELKVASHVLEDRERR